MATKGALLLLVLFVCSCLLLHTDAARTSIKMDDTGMTYEGPNGEQNGNGDAATGNGDEYNHNNGGSLPPPVPKLKNPCEGMGFCAGSHQEAISVSYTNAVIALASVIMFGIA